MIQGDVPSDRVPLGPSQRRITTAIDAVIAVLSSGAMVAWVFGHPLFYTPNAPVLSAFTAFSLLLMVLVRQARLHLRTWPIALSLAMTGLVLGGNAASIVMLATMPARLWETFSGVVVTSTMTSIGLVLFCLYDFGIALRETPRSTLPMDDMLIHLALVPGGVSLLGYLLGNPTYLSVHIDPRVGISPFEMGLMGLYASGAILSNPGLFLWRFLASGWTNRFVFAGLFANQFVAPLAVALVFATPGSDGPGVELFAMLAGVVTTLSFLMIQARVTRSQPAAGSAPQ